MNDSEFLNLVAHHWKPDCIGFKVNGLTGKIDLVRGNSSSSPEFKLSNTGVTGNDISECISQLKDLFVKYYLQNQNASKQQ